MMGIYAIRNTKTGEEYIGSSLDTGRRWGEHKRRLLEGRHPTKPLQAAWNEYGERRFVFDILHEVDDLDALLHLEAVAMRDRKPTYNLATMHPDRAPISPRAPGRQGPRNALELTPDDTDLLPDSAVGVFTCECCGELQCAISSPEGPRTVPVPREEVKFLKWTHFILKRLDRISAH